MPPLKIEKLIDGLSADWSGFLRDWDRALRAGPEVVVPSTGSAWGVDAVGPFLVVVRLAGRA